MIEMIASQYNIIKILAQGGFSKVYLVEDTKNENKLYALKAIENPNSRYRIDNELKIFKKISKLKNIIQLRKVFQVSRKWYFLFDYASGNSISYKIKEQGKLKNKEIVDILKTMIKTLKEVHSLNIIHNDIKPENILINNNDYYLCDWGISINKKEVQTIHISTDTAFIAPEVYKGKFDTRSDIYSLGATLYYLTTGEKLYKIDKESTYSYIMYSHSLLSADLSLIESKKLRYIIFRMLEKNPNRRASLNEIESLLENRIEKSLIPKVKIVDYNLYKNRDKYELYEELTKENIASAIYSLGYLYEFKEKKDMKKALVLYEKAAIKGSIKAMYSLGRCYFNHKEVKKNDSKAYYWFKEASNKEYEKAQYFLAYFYEKGIFIKKDINMAINLYKSSAYLGYKNAHLKLKKLIFN